MKMLVQVVLEVDPEKWAEGNSGPWPEDDKRSLNTAVRQDIKSHIQHYLDNPYFKEAGIRAEIR